MQNFLAQSASNVGAKLLEKSSLALYNATTSIIYTNAENFETALPLCLIEKVRRQRKRSFWPLDFLSERFACMFGFIIDHCTDFVISHSFLRRCKTPLAHAWAPSPSAPSSPAPTPRRPRLAANGSTWTSSPTDRRPVPPRPTPT